MAEPLKNSFGPDVPARIGEMIRAVHPEFDIEGFLGEAQEGYEARELTDRARHIALVLADFLPEDREEAMEILTASLGPEIEDSELTGMGPFLYLPHVYFVGREGLDCFEASMKVQYELTKRFTAEFSIRAFLDRYPRQTLDRLRVWARDPNVHVRRLVSEGTRPRLPWAPRLLRFQEDPNPVLDLLETLKDDPEEYVRRSVANNLNDISKDHPQVVVELAGRWWKDASVERKRLVKHALRTLVKNGHPGALRVLGYRPDTPAAIEEVRCLPDRVEIGDSVRVEVAVDNPSDGDVSLLIDLRLHFVKASGATSPKVFKGAEVVLGPKERKTLSRRISLAQQSTRTHYPGVHRIEVLMNGVAYPGPEFRVVSPKREGTGSPPGGDS